MTVTCDKDLSYTVIRSRRKTADIVVERDGRVLVRAPKALTDRRIRTIVESRKLWIYKTLAEWRDANATRVLRGYRNGEGFLYLGRSYRLLLVANQEEPVQLKSGRFCMRRDLVESGHATRAKEALRHYLTERALERISQRVAYFAPKVGVASRRVAVRDLKNRWASCSANGNLAFHWKCIMAPASVIDYIVVHELCHLHHLDHTEAFWNEVDKLIPDYRERKDWLRTNGAAMDL
ncbi:MAG: M48 family metallopeptidase [Verrucomicrobiaceae bacterium]|nr:M48 family metallopeptidase [Verrucomicrobiaceae bacterium]